MVLMLQGEHDLAGMSFAEALECHLDLRQPIGVAVAWDNLGSLANRRGRHDEALACHRTALSEFVRLGYPAGEADSRRGIGVALAGLGRVYEALDELSHAVEVGRSVGEADVEMNAWCEMGRVLLTAGRVDASESAYAEVVRLAESSGDRLPPGHCRGRPLRRPRGAGRPRGGGRAPWQRRDRVPGDGYRRPGPRARARCRSARIPCAVWVIDARGRIRGMAMTAQVKAELANTQITKTCCRKAEVATMLRFAGGLHIVSGKIVVEAELDTGAAARRLRKDIAEVYGHQAEFAMVQGNGIRKGSRYLVRVVKDGEALARQTGLLDQRGRPVRGLPPAVVSGGGCDSVAAWRGAFLAHGSLTEPGRSSSLEVTCPGPEAALALVGVARRLGIQAKAREVRGVDRVVIRDGDAIGELLTRLGAHESLMAWEERRMRREVRATANRLANFDDANLRRSARAAVAAGARVERALEILGDDVPDHLRLAGDLRLKHKQASLEELGQLHDPVLTKDAIAGRIRRLLAMADKRAEDLGIPDTEASLTPEMLADEG